MKASLGIGRGRTSSGNLDPDTIAGFGEEWSRFDQSAMDWGELETLFHQYFRIFPWEALSQGAVGFDLGCGSGRWACFVAPRVGTLHCIDPSDKALDVARRNLRNTPNCQFHLAGVDQMPLADGVMDFGYSLGVLHHVPDTQAGIQACAAKLKPGAPLLVYLYYAFDNRPPWFRALWRVSDHLRRLVSRLPHSLRYWTAFSIAVSVYLPLAGLAGVLERLGFRVDGFPLAFYRNRSFYVMHNDALDRFGTRLEKRFTAGEIQAMMESAGLDRIAFSPDPPYWCAVGYRRA